MPAITTSLISVIIPAHNRRHMLAQALWSLVHQTYSNFVVLICDDASTENLEEETSRFSQLKIEFHRFEENGGARLNHQRGADLCQTRYAILLNSDDLLLPDALQKMVDALEGHSAAACQGGSVEFRQRGEGMIEIIKETLPEINPAIKAGQWLPLRRIGNCGPSQTLLRMDAFRAAGGYNQGCRTIYDWELALALHSGEGIIALQEVTTAYRHHDDQLIRQNTVAEGALSARDTFFVTSEENPMRGRMRMPRLQQAFLRQWVGWSLIRQSLRGSKPVADLLQVLRLLTDYGMLVQLAVCAPLWFLIFLVTRPPSRREAIVLPERRKHYTEILNRLLRPSAQGDNPKVKSPLPL